jgi:hypothetical protein
MPACPFLNNYGGQEGSETQKTNAHSLRSGWAFVFEMWMPTIGSTVQIDRW